MANDNTGKRPTHRLHAVQKRGDESYWTEIGAAWAHEDGEGFTIKLNLLPLAGQDIVVRKPKAKEDETEGRDSHDDRGSTNKGRASRRG